MSQLIKPITWQVLDANGDPESGAQAEFYKSGTTTQITTYKDSALSSTHPFPVLAVNSGMFPPIYVTEAVVKVVIKDSSGVEIETVDPIRTVYNNLGGADLEEINDLYFDGDWSAYSNGGQIVSYDETASEYSWKAKTFKDVVFGTAVKLANSLISNVTNFAYRDVDSSYLQFSGGSDEDLGGVVRVYGEDHATKANDIELISGVAASRTTVYSYDDSASQHDFLTTAIANLGALNGSEQHFMKASGGTLTGNIVGNYSSGETRGTDTVAIAVTDTSRYCALTVMLNVDTENINNDRHKRSQWYLKYWDGSAWTAVGPSHVIGDLYNAPDTTYDPHSYDMVSWTVVFSNTHANNNQWQFQIHGKALDNSNVRWTSRSGQWSAIEYKDVS